MKNTLIIVGGGPVGLTAALRFKSNFREIIVLEKESEEKNKTSSGFVFPLMVMVPAIKVLREVGAWEIMNRVGSKYSSSNSSVTLPFGAKIYKVRKPASMLANWRYDVVNALHECIDAAENISVFYEAKLQHIDFENNICKVLSMDEMKFDLLVGADGIRSQVRGMMAKTHSKFSEDEFYTKDLYDWCSFNMPTPVPPAIQNKYGDKVFINIDSRTASTDMMTAINHVMYYPVGTSEEKVLELMRNEFKGMGLEDKQVDSLVKTGCFGIARQVFVPSSVLGSVVLLGDSAHGFLSAGDAVSLGILTVGEFYKVWKGCDGKSNQACIEYDNTIGSYCREYALFAYRRAYGEAVAETIGLELTHKAGITSLHPNIAMYMDPNFEFIPAMEEYRKINPARLVKYVLNAAKLIVVALSTIVVKRVLELLR